MTNTLKPRSESERAMLLARHRRQYGSWHTSETCTVLRKLGRPWEIRKQTDSPTPWDWHLTYRPEREENSPYPEVSEYYSTFEDAVRGLVARIRQHAKEFADSVGVNV